MDGFTIFMAGVAIFMVGVGLVFTILVGKGKKKK